MVADIVEEVGKALFHFIVETLCFYTGEVVLCVVTFGNRKPRWDFYSNESPAKFVILSEVSTWIGFVVWVFTIGFLARALLR